METGQASGGGGGGGGDYLSSSSSTPDTIVSRWSFSLSRRYQHLLDKSVPHVLYRWIGCLVAALLYALRVYFVQGFYIVTYGLGIYLLNLLIGFLSPQIDPEIHNQDGPTLPTRGSDEFRPFVRRLPEFKFWYIQFLVWELNWMSIVKWEWKV
uniref:Protein RER1 n=1 Tax=Rhizophora mucronata TaxID=61149 RepID=A0A2P2JKU4_RHIMU